MRAVVHVLAWLALAGCEPGGEPRRVEHRAVYATDLGISDLTIARRADGASMLFWTEGTLGRGSPTWMRVGETVAHRMRLAANAELDDRSFSPLVPLDDPARPFVIYAFDGFFGTPILHEISIDAEGGLGGYRSDLAPMFSWVGLPLEAFALPAGDVALLGYHPTEYALILTSAVPGESFGGQPVLIASLGTICAPQMLGTSTPARVGVIVAIACDQVGAAETYAATVENDVTEETVFSAGPFPTPGDLIDVVANEDGVAVLVAPGEGGVAAFVTPFDAEDVPEELPDRMFAATPWERGGPLTGPRMFATDHRFVVVWNEQVDAAETRTRAVTLAADGGVGDVFDWPLPDDECAVHSAVAMRDRLEYTCEGRCQGAGCAEHWIYRGEIALP